MRLHLFRCYLLVAVVLELVVLPCLSVPDTASASNSQSTPSANIHKPNADDNESSSAPPQTKARLPTMLDSKRRLPLKPPLLVTRRYWNHRGQRRTEASPMLQKPPQAALPPTSAGHGVAQVGRKGKEEEDLAATTAAVAVHDGSDSASVRSTETSAAVLSVEPSPRAAIDSASESEYQGKMVNDTVPRGGKAADLHVGSKKTASLNSNGAPPPTGMASIVSEIMTLTKAIVGAGVLGLPAGLATFYTLDSPSPAIQAVVETLGEGFVEDTASTVLSSVAAASKPSLGRTIFAPTLLLISIIGSASALGFDLIASVCDATQSVSYRQAWANTVSEASSWIPAAACLLVTTCTTITCSMILKSTLGTRTFLGVTGGVLLPLCLQQSLKKLAPCSVIGTLGMLYTAIVMALRYVTKAYTPSSKLGLYADIVEDNLRPAGLGFGWKQADNFALAASATAPPQIANPWFNLLNIKKGAILISMLSTSFMAHYNAPKLYWELRDTSPQRFRKVIMGGFGAAITLMSTIALSGFLTFGSASSGMILNNYAPTDGLAALARAAVTVSVIFTVPLAFVGVRDGVLDLCKIDPKQRQGAITTWATVAGLAFITSMALILRDIRIVLAIGGSTWGMCVIYLFPALMVIHGATLFPVLKPKVPLAKGLATMGLVVGSMGIYRTLTTLL